ASASPHQLALSSFDVGPAALLPGRLKSLQRPHEVRLRGLPAPPRPKRWGATRASLAPRQENAAQPSPRRRSRERSEPRSLSQVVLGGGRREGGGEGRR